MNCLFVYQNLTLIQKKQVINLWLSEGVLTHDQAHRRSEEVSVLIKKDNDMLIGVSTVYLSKLKENEKPWFFFRMFIKADSRGDNQLRTEVIRLNYLKLKEHFGTEIQGIALELENLKLIKLSKTTDYMQRRGYTYHGVSKRGLPLWFVSFDQPKGIFINSDKAVVVE